MIKILLSSRLGEGGERSIIKYKADETNIFGKAILELIEKCDTLEGLRKSMKRIMNEQ